MNKTIIIPKDELEHIVSLTKMTTKEIFEKYGYEKEKVFSHFVKFEDNTEAFINLTIMPEDDWCPITDITLFRNGKELTHYTSMDSKYEGLWEIEFEGINYMVEVIKSD